MQSIYVSYKCARCRKSTILLVEEAGESFNDCKYLACANCVCKKFNEEKATDDLRETMKAIKYKKNSHGALEQI